jgi:DNA-dependent RNA polymerase auxiliary subunit epsilon
MAAKKTFKVEFVGSGAEVTDRNLSKSHLAKDLNVVAERDLRWNRGSVEFIENPDATLLEYFQIHKDEFKVTELKASDAASDTPAE